MVRLKLLDRFQNEYGRQGFNSTMVRLKLIPPIAFNVVLNKFQFHYGAIKTKEINAISVYITEFQFHYGAIKTIQNTIKKCAKQLFQFHYGAIKTGLNL